MAVNEPQVFATLLAKLLPLQVTAKPEVPITPIRAGMSLQELSDVYHEMLHITVDEYPRVMEYEPAPSDA